ncbi:NHLP bacteriocin export ABC transporter permease/ATPase subunit [Ensifer sp. ENS09]|uniref:NHLP bacteriocin export ABC transporter permease/ATPase subunit n=1 Tax=Ensifer sp. ENS09 TaxID=2769263 RepID=UPI001786B389|nr:NHLP bacteriocin export ABC transporter permease/ATPase subunit [Ensifer sp. ENS09]MBD9651393.1 NHLP bacteriocin export ABC transporter permease/ATPase subunit [Ensifer sp. ENS09]
MTGPLQPIAYDEERSNSGLMQVFGEPPGNDGSGAPGAGTPLVEAIAMALQAAGHPVSAEALCDLNAQASEDDAPALLTRAGVAFRPVELAADWWRHDGLPMLAELEDGTPVALVPGAQGGWRIVMHGKSIRATARAAAQVRSRAIQIYPLLPRAPATLGGLLRFGLRGAGMDVARMAIMAALANLSAIALPIAAILLVEHVIPSGDRAALLQILIGLVAIAFGQTAFDLVRAFAMARIETRLDATLQAAVFHRLLRLPAHFFKGFTTGDLAERVLSLQEARQMVTGSMLSGLFGILGILTSAAVLFLTDWRLALVGVSAAALLAFVSAVVSWRQLLEERHQIEARGEVQGFVLQLLFGIVRLRGANAEERALTRWGSKSARQRQAFMQARLYRAWQSVLQVSMPWLCLLLIYASVGWLGNLDETQPLHALAAPTDGDNSGTLSIAVFAAFATAFGQLTAALRASIGAVSGLVAVVPLVQRTRPVLDAQPEQETLRNAPLHPDLQGNVVFRNVHFRYFADGPPVLEDVSFEVAAGEFVAIVGPSGSGKSTLLRLMLGFETLESGEILFDGIPVDALEPSFIRRHMGVVLQNSMLFAGSIYDNIAGASGCGPEAVLEASILAGLEQDIAAMPMGLHTILADGGNTLSGGQRQRILVARALIGRPKILLLDEATSALDNRTQAAVSERLAELNTTRIVIAHRLSTIRKADRIIVLDRGRVVQVGPFDALARAGGCFARLAAVDMLGGR